jgi:hypothetical protein
MLISAAMLYRYAQRLAPAPCMYTSANIHVILSDRRLHTTAQDCASKPPEPPAPASNEPVVRRHFMPHHACARAQQRRPILHLPATTLLLQRARAQPRDAEHHAAALKACPHATASKARPASQSSSAAAAEGRKRRECQHPRLWKTTRSDCPLPTRQRKPTDRGHAHA